MGDGVTNARRRMMLRIREPQVRAHKRKREHCCIGRSPMSAHLKIWSTRTTTTSYVTLLRVSLFPIVVCLGYKMRCRFNECVTIKWCTDFLLSCVCRRATTP